MNYFQSTSYVMTSTSQNILWSHDNGCDHEASCMPTPDQELSMQVQTKASHVHLARMAKLQGNHTNMSPFSIWTSHVRHPDLRITLPEFRRRILNWRLKRSLVPMVMCGRVSRTWSVAIEYVLCSIEHGLWQ